MPGTLIDSNVLLDILTEDEEWFDWSSSMLEAAAHRGTLVINPIIYAEVSVAFPRIEDLDESLPRAYYRREELPWAAGFPRRPCVCEVSPSRWRAPLAPARFLCGRARGALGAQLVDA